MSNESPDICFVCASCGDLVEYRKPNSPTLRTLGDWVMFCSCCRKTPMISKSKSIPKGCLYVGVDKEV